MIFLQLLWTDNIEKGNPEVVFKVSTSLLFGFDCNPFSVNIKLDVHLKNIQISIRLMFHNFYLIFIMTYDLYTNWHHSSKQNEEDALIFTCYGKLF